MMIAKRTKNYKCVCTGHKYMRTRSIVHVRSDSSSRVWWYRAAVGAVQVA